MTTMRLYGTFTSPYVRRVRIVALELGMPIEMVDTTTDEGQAAMRAVNPLWKVPTVELDGSPIMDSRNITEHLLRIHGPGPLSAMGLDDVEAHNVYTVVDGVVDALINTFYLARDGIAGEQASYMQKQHERAAAGMAWLEQRVDDVWLTRERAFGLVEIALCTSVEWMRFRSTYPVQRHPALMRCVEHHAERPSLVKTRPPA